MPHSSNTSHRFRVDSLEELSEDIKSELFGWFGYEEPDQNEAGDLLRHNFDNSDKVYLYINFDTLGFVKAEFEVRMLAFFQALHKL